MVNEIEKLRVEYENSTYMQAAGITERAKVGGVADKLKILQIPKPSPNTDEVVIKLAASSLHLDEIYAAQGTALGRFYGPSKLSVSKPHLLGSSVSGAIVAIGSDVEQFTVGDEVIAIPSEQMETGSWATYRCVAAQSVMRKPAELTHVEAAAATMAACVAWGAIGFANVQSSDRCVVVGASGAVGSMTLQYLKSLGCHVTAVCSGDNERLVRWLGADTVIDYRHENFGQKSDNEDPLYDAVFDCVGGLDIEQAANSSLKNDGVFVTVVGPRKYVGEQRLSWLAVLRVLGHIAWRMLKTRVCDIPKYTFSAKFPRLVINEAMEQLLKNDIRIPIDEVIPFEESRIQEAIVKLYSHRTKGRIVIDFSLPDDHEA